VKEGLLTADFLVAEEFFVGNIDEGRIQVAEEVRRKQGLAF